MRTQMMIMAIVGTVFVAGIGVLVALVLWLGWLAGGGVAAGILVAVISLYLWVVKPWHMRWGATDGEVARTMPGDELIPDAGSATRAVTIAATPEEIWPWLVQLGFGRAGWYSYDWIDNDFQASADRILPEYQNLKVGDKILMMPKMGFVVESVDQPHSIVSVLEDGSTSWCLGLYPIDGRGTRLVSRWRPKFEITPATLFLTALAEPGTFIMEQKMLRTIRDRVETARTTEPEPIRS
ncbi:MAG: hypothetical protein OEM84_12635 [Acidimicrobiia bacterium]|nr:hypothetical protein [Acidimicrobiia bacterium]MDH5615054.1 hypothetical protein [Acidimicrobiia bacterium]